MIIVKENNNQILLNKSFHMKNNLPLGVILSLICAFLYSSQTTLIKLEASYLPPLPVIIFFQSLVALLLILPIVFRSGYREAKQVIITKKLKLHFLRTIFSLSISFLLFYAITYIPLVNGILLANTAPLMVPFLGYFFLSQKINHRLWLPIIIGLAGVTLVLQPDVRIFNSASLLALAAACAMAASMLTVRKLSATESTHTTAFYFFFLSTLLSGVIAIKFLTPISV